MVEVFKLQDFIVKYNEIFIKSNDGCGDYLVSQGVIYNSFKDYFVENYKIPIYEVVIDFTGKFLYVILDKDSIHSLTLKLLPECGISIDIDYDENGICLGEHICLTFSLVD